MKDGRLLAAELIMAVKEYKGLEKPFYTVRLEYWDRQANYAEKLLDNRWEATPQQTKIFELNLIKLSDLIAKLSKEN